MTTTSKSHAHSPSATTTAGATDSDNPQSMVITSLRSQVADLVSQVTQLNSKLVQSYDRISDLEDNIHIASSTLRNATLKVSQLELERTQHLSALNTGLLVEKSHVTAELTRLMEKATDEAARRGMAESARQEIEKDLDDLSAELFNHANNMVAEARLAQAKSERRVQDAEAVLKGAEEAVGLMQSQMQALREEKDRTDRELNDLRDLMGKGKWVERERPSAPLSLKLLSTHVPYQEFLLFVAHLRQIRPVTPQPPPMATLLPLPFLTRLVSEDADPTLRLDAAPSLNWLTRRSVVSAIHQSQLTVEPISINGLLELFAPPGSSAAISAFATYTVASPQQTVNVACALCGKSVLSTPLASSPPITQANGTASWRLSFLAKSTPTKHTHPPAIHSPTPSVATTASFYPPSTSSGPGRLSPPPTPPLPSSPSMPQMYVFRLQPAAGQVGAQVGVYPLCTTGWCLARLRATCELWRFVRHGVIERVWEEEVPDIGVGPGTGRAVERAGKPPPVPPRRRTMNVGKLIGLASSALGMEKPAGGKGGSGSATPTKQGAEPEERFSPPPVMTRRSIGDAARKRGSSPPPLPQRSGVRAVGRGETKKADESVQLDTANAGSVVDLTDVKVSPVEDGAKPEMPAPAADVPHVPEAQAEKVEHTLDTVNTSTPMEQVVSNEDEFVTPQDTPAQSPTREQSVVSLFDAAQVPLPESPVEEEHGGNAEASPPETTPVPAPAPEFPPAPTPETPAADLVAAPDIAASTSETSPPAETSSITPAPAPPSHTASPALPPLPRRAARRAVPAPPSGPRPASRGGSPRPNPSPRPAADTPRETAADESDASKYDRDAAVTGREVEKEPRKQDEDEGYESKRDGSDVAAGEPRRDENGIVPHNAAHDAASPLPPLPAGRDAAPPPPPRDVPASPEEHEPYIGDATWEERTWKELVRLREDMFYARLGTVR